MTRCKLASYTKFSSKFSWGIHICFIKHQQRPASHLKEGLPLLGFPMSSGKSFWLFDSLHIIWSALILSVDLCCGWAEGTKGVKICASWINTSCIFKKWPREHTYLTLAVNTSFQNHNPIIKSIHRQKQPESSHNHQPSKTNHLSAMRLSQAFVSLHSSVCLHFQPSRCRGAFLSAWNQDLSTRVQCSTM